MIMQLEFDIDSNNELIMLVRVQTDNEIPLTHINHLKLGTDPVKALLRLFKTMPTIEFKDITAVASSEAIEKIRKEQEEEKLKNTAQEAKEEIAEGEIVG